MDKYQTLFAGKKRGSEWLAADEQRNAYLDADFAALMGLAAISTTPFSIATGEKTFGLSPADTELPVGAMIRARRLADPSVFLVGLATATSAGSVTIDVVAVGGSGGPYTDWIVGVDIGVGPASTTIEGILRLATTGEGQSGSSAAIGMTPAATKAAAIYQGKHVFVLDAWCFKKAETNGPEAMTSLETSTNKVRTDCWAFDAATPETIQSRQAFGKSFDGATAFRARFGVGSRSGTGNVKIGVAGVSIRSGDDLDTAFGTEQTVVFNVAATNKFYWTDWTTAFAFGGTHADMAWKSVKVRRVADDGTNDVKSGDLDLFKVAFEPVFNLANDA